MTRLNRLAAGTVIGFWMSLLPAAAAPPQIVPHHAAGTAVRSHGHNRRRRDGTAPESAHCAAGADCLTDREGACGGEPRFRSK